MKWLVYLLAGWISCVAVTAQDLPSILNPSEPSQEPETSDPAAVPESVEEIEAKQKAFRAAYTFPPEEAGDDPSAMKKSRLVYELDAIYENQIASLIQLQEAREELKNIGSPESWPQVTAVGDLTGAVTFAQIEQLLAYDNQLSQSGGLVQKEVSRADSNLTVARNAYQSIQTRITGPLKGSALSLEEQNEELNLRTTVEQYVLRRIQSRLARERRDLIIEKISLFQPFLASCMERLELTEEDYEKRMKLISEAERQLDPQIMTAQRQLARAEAAWETFRDSLPEEPDPLQAARLVALDFERQASLAKVSHLQRAISQLSIRKEKIQTVFAYYRGELSNREILNLQSQVSDAVKRLRSEVDFMENELEQAREKLDTRQRQLTVDDPERLAFFQQAFKAAQNLVEMKQNEVAEVNRMLADSENFLKQLNQDTGQFDPKMIASRIGFRLANIWNFEFFRLDDNPFTVSTLVWITGALAGTLFLSWLLAWAATAFLRNKTNLDPRVASASRKLFFYLNMVIGAIIVFWIFDFPLSSLAIPTSILALAVGFASQEILKNFMSGIILLLERPIAHGDIIEMADRILSVESIGARSTRLRDYDGTEKIVPNSILLENVIVNRTLSDRSIRATIDVGVAYGSPTRKTDEVLLDAARQVDGVFDNPAPFVIFDHFGDNALLFRLYFWCSADNRLRICSELRHVIDEKLNEVGITIAFPQRDVHLDAARPLQIEWAHPPGSEK